MKTQRAFTLIELLTVIAIIGILAAILIPVVSRVRESAKSSVCQSNLRQIGIAAHLYAADHDDFLPPNRPGHIASLIASTRDAFDTYLDRGGEVFYCPNEGIPTSRRTTYGDPLRAWTTPEAPGGAYYIGYFWLGNPTVGGDPEAFWLDSRRTGTTRDEFLIRVTEDNATDVPIAVDHTQQGGSVGTWVLRHPLTESGNMNVLFGDGHVESRSYSEIRSRWHAPSPVGW